MKNTFFFWKCIVCYALLLITVFCCRRQEAIHKTNPLPVKEVRSWLQQHGGSYKNETMTVKTEAGNLVTGKLDWGKAKQYPYEGKDYVDVPFVFAQGRYITGSGNIAPAAFNMVIRRDTKGSYEGAVRTTTISVEANTTAGDAPVSTLLRYYLLNGKEANIWRAGSGDSSFVKVYDIPLTAIESAMRKQAAIPQKNVRGVTSPQETKIMFAGDGGRSCATYSYTTYASYCVGSNPDPNSVSVTCVSYPVTSYYTFCYDVDSGIPPYTGGNYPPGGCDCGGTRPTLLEGPVKKPKDPCADAKPGAAKATTLSSKSKFADAKADIQNAAADGKEHGISFGKDANGNIITSTVTTGTSNSGTVGSVSNRFADLHNHPNNDPPSSGDIYGLIDIITHNANYETRYIVTSNGTVYALIVTNRKAAMDFNTNYPRVPGITNPTTGEKYEPTFPEALVDERIEMVKRDGASEEQAIAFTLLKYNSGIALLKQSADGNFRRLNTKEHTDANGNKTYTSDNCP